MYLHRPDLAKLLAAVAFYTTTFIDMRHPVLHRNSLTGAGSGAFSTPYALIFDYDGTGRKKIGKTLKNPLLRGIGENEIGYSDLIDRSTDNTVILGIFRQISSSSRLLKHG